MKNKTVRFDMSVDTLYEMAENRRHEGDYCSALRMLHKSVGLYGPGAEELAAMCDSYEEMGLYEHSAECWFRYLDICAEEESVDGYEGLAVCYYNIGNDAVASYYYGKMLSDRFLSGDNGIEMGELFNQEPRAPLKVVWPPESADYSDEIDAGLKALKENDFETAEQQFLKINSKSEFYPSAMNYLAVTYLMKGESKRAEETCLELLKRSPNDVQAMSTYAAVLTEQDRKEEGRHVAEMLARMPVSETDELYKIATVCCENGLYEEAFQKFDALTGPINYDRTLQYFKAVAAFRCGRTEESLAALGMILDIQPRAAVARYYYREVQRYLKEGGVKPETTFFCHVPQPEREKRIALLQTLSEMHKDELIAYFNDNADADELLEWCFDEADGREVKLQLIGISVALRANRELFVSECLLNPNVNSVVKAEAVYELCSRNKDMNFSVVVADIYRRLAFKGLEIGREKRVVFIRAYAVCFSRFVLFSNESGEKFKTSAEEIYQALEEAQRLQVVKDAESLAFVIALDVYSDNQERVQQLFQNLKINPEEVGAILNAMGADEVLLDKEAAVTEDTSAETDEKSNQQTEENTDETH